MTALHCSVVSSRGSRRPELVAVVRGLAEQPDARSALTAAGIPAGQHAAYADALASAGVPEPERPAYLDALSGLAATGILTRKDGA